MFYRSLAPLLALGAMLVAQDVPPSTPAGPSAAPAEAKAPAMDPPRLRFEPSGRVDLGVVGPREVKVQHYLIHNTSDAPIGVRVFDLSPGVKVAGPALLGPIPAHGSAGLELTLDPTDWTGVQTRNVRLGTDDPRQGAYYLPTRIQIRPDLSVTPPGRIDFGDVAVNESRQETFSFVRETGELLSLKVAQTLPDYLDMEIVEQRNTGKLVFTFRPDKVPPGVRLGFEQVTVTSNAPREPKFDLYLGWKLHHAVDALPSRLVFTGTKVDRLELALKSHAGKPFQVLKAEVEGAGFEVLAPGAGSAPDQVLTVRRTATGQAKAMLVLCFQGEDQPLRVPLVFLP